MRSKQLNVVIIATDHQNGILLGTLGHREMCWNRSAQAQTRLKLHLPRHCKNVRLEKLVSPHTVTATASAAAPCAQTHCNSGKCEDCSCAKSSKKLNSINITNTKAMFADCKYGQWFLQIPEEQPSATHPRVLQNSWAPKRPSGWTTSHQTDCLRLDVTDPAVVVGHQQRRTKDRSLGKTR